MPRNKKECSQTIESVKNLFHALFGAAENTALTTLFKQSGKWNVAAMSSLLKKCGFVIKEIEGKSKLVLTKSFKDLINEGSVFKDDVYLNKFLKDYKEIAYNYNQTLSNKKKKERAEKKEKERLERMSSQQANAEIKHAQENKEIIKTHNIYEEFDKLKLELQTVNDKLDKLLKIWE